MRVRAQRFQFFEPFLELAFADGSKKLVVPDVLESCCIPAAQAIALSNRHRNGYCKSRSAGRRSKAALQLRLQDAPRGGVARPHLSENTNSRDADGEWLLDRDLWLERSEPFEP